MKTSLIFFAFLICLDLLGQSTMNDQQAYLSQYLGTWSSAESSDDTTYIEMNVQPRLNMQAVSVDVYKCSEKSKAGILSEVIAYNQDIDSIVAFGQTNIARSFIGKGLFIDSSYWVMHDRNFLDQPTMQVDFNFLDPTEVLVQGKDMTDSGNDWKLRYIKQNSRRKNIGIQLVSVRYLMEKDPIGTLMVLGRMGFSYVETFVYNKGRFYGMTPLEFKKLVEDQGMKFKGSMVFQDLPDVENLHQAMAWWGKCISDHREAGVKYMTTSNHQVHQMKTKADLDRFCQYYNKIGRLCLENGIDFAIHNHTEEFLFVDGHRVYDYLLAHTNPKYVSFQCDLYWMNMAGVDPIDYFKKYPDRFISWHVKDDAELGHSGKIDYKRIYQHAEESGLVYNVFEIEQFKFSPLISINMGFSFLFHAPFVETYGINEDRIKM